jgi:hypothetical protein
MIDPPPRTIPLGARLGCWIGAFGWLIGFVAVTLPDGTRFAPEMAGGLVVTLAVASLLDWTMRRAPVFPFGLFGAMFVGIAAVGVYWNRIVEPAVVASPVTFERLRWLNTLGRPGAGSITHFPEGALAAQVVVGLVLLAAAWLWKQPERQGM